MPLDDSGNPPESMPVMVWIHGGAYTGGGGNWDMYGPEKFMDFYNVILVSLFSILDLSLSIYKQVSMNYRLSTVGWLTLDDDEHVGNQGLYDTLTALKWVQTNIDNFGGDPSQVTIFGESAGSWSCSYLIVSPLAQVQYISFLNLEVSSAYTLPMIILLLTLMSLRVFITELFFKVDHGIVQHGMHLKRRKQ